MKRKNYVGSEQVGIGRAKVSDGKSVDVLVPADVEVLAGNFCYLDGFLGAAFETVEKGVEKEIALNIEQAEYETDQIVKGDKFEKGSIIYFDDKKGVFTEAETGFKAGKVTMAKDGNNVIWFILLPQAAITAAVGE